MRDETEGIIVSLGELSDAIRSSGPTLDDPLAALTAEGMSSSRDELQVAIARAKQAADESGTAAADLDEAAGALRSYLEHVF